MDKFLAGWFAMYLVTMILAMIIGIGVKDITPEKMEKVVYACENQGGFKTLSFESHWWWKEAVATCENGNKIVVDINK